MAHRTRDLWTYACGSCGYVELHLHAAEDIGFIRAKWPHVPPTAPPRT